MALVGGAATVWPCISFGQQPAMRVVGFLGGAGEAEWRAFQEGLSETGHIEGKDIAIEYRQVSAGADPSALAADLVNRKVAVIAVAPAIGYVLAAKASTSSIPIVFHVGSDPLKFGLVQSMSRPSGNITGVSNLNVELGPKRLELLIEIAPQLKSVALLINPENPNAQLLIGDLKEAVRSRELQLHVLRARNESEVETAFASLSTLQVGGLIISPDGFLGRNARQLAVLAARYAVPSIYTFRGAAVAGGLMSYGGATTEAYRLLGVYVGRILKGEKPADLPVQQSARVQLIINLKTAKALGITIPPAVLARADEVIE
jgi:putative ABC transport system substrate-binding protein